MIVVKRKPLEKIFDMLKNSSKVLILGCDGCAAIYQVGGLKQAEILSTLLDMAEKMKGKVKLQLKVATVLRQCDRQILFDSLGSFVKEYDTILSLACGVGVQTLAETFQDKTVLPANDTMFIGTQEPESFRELCKACGDCILHETGGVCPITRCAKSLLNGPCGGQSKGKCEVGGWKKDCAWVLIYNRLKEHGKLDLFIKFRPPRDYRTSQWPRELGVDEVMGRAESTKEGETA